MTPCRYHQENEPVEEAATRARAVSFLNISNVPFKIELISYFFVDNLLKINSIMRKQWVGAVFSWCQRSRHQIIVSHC